MTKELSLYLDFMRILAAFAVFFEHIKRPSITYGVFEPIGIYGQEGVVIFFVISGLVIGHVATTKEHAPWPYARARLARLWSVVVPAILLTIVLDVIGHHIDAGIYNEPGLPPTWGWDLASLWRALAPMLFVNRILGWDVNPGTNAPFWSLGYEAWYYVAFGVCCFARGYVRVIILLLIAALVDREVVLLFPIWLLGLWVYGRVRQPAAAGQFGAHAVLFFASGVGVLAVTVLKYKLLNLVFAVLPFENNAASDYWFFIGQNYALGLLFALNLLAFARIGSGFSALLYWAAPGIRALAGRSFSLYLYQVPTIFCFGAITSGMTSPTPRVVLEFAGVLGTIFLLANVTELKKHVVANWLSRGVARFAARPGLRPS